MKLLQDINGWVQNGPMGNDKQIGWVLPALSMGASVASGLMSARKNPNQPLGAGAIRKHMAPMQGVVNQMQSGYGQMQNMGQQMMDPNSAMNQQQFQMMGEQSADQLAMQHMLARRQAAALGQDSGITAAQSRTTQADMNRAVQERILKQMSTNRMQGIGILGQSQGLLGNIGRMQQGISENIAQADIAKQQHKANEWQRRNQIGADVMGGIGSGLMGLHAQGANNIDMSSLAPEGMIWDGEKFIADPNL